MHDDDTEATLAARVLAVEHRIYPLALALVAQGRVRIVDGRCVIEGAAPSAGTLIVPQDGRDGSYMSGSPSSHCAAG